MVLIASVWQRFHGRSETWQLQQCFVELDISAVSNSVFLKDSKDDPLCVEVTCDYMAKISHEIVGFNFGLSIQSSIIESSLFCDHAAQVKFRGIHGELCAEFASSMRLPFRGIPKDGVPNLLDQKNSLQGIQPPILADYPNMRMKRRRRKGAQTRAFSGGMPTQNMPL